MNGLLIENVSDEVLSKALCAVGDGVYSVWTTTSFEEMLESVSGENNFPVNEINVDEFYLPFMSGDKVVPVRGVIAFGIGKKLVPFLFRSASVVIAARDLNVPSLVEFLREESAGHQVDLAWYSTRVSFLCSLASWTIWLGLPDPCEIGNQALILARDSIRLKGFAAAIQSMIEEAWSNGMDPTISKGAHAGRATVSIVDVETELVRLAPKYEPSA